MSENELLLLELSKSKQGKIREIKLLLKSGVNVNILDTDGYRTPLMWACQVGNIKIVKLLLENGADINMQNWQDDTALMTSIHNIGIVKLLIKHNIDVNIQDNQGDSALIDASWLGLSDIVQVLLDNGANINAKNIHGHSALDIAKGSPEEMKSNGLLKKSASRKKQYKIYETIQILEEYIFNNKTAKIDIEQTVFSI